jgi:hypothetical protein
MKGNKGTREQGNKGTREQGNKGTREQGNNVRNATYIFNILFSVMLIIYYLSFYNI